MKVEVHSRALQCERIKRKQILEEIDQFENTLPRSFSMVAPVEIGTIESQCISAIYSTGGYRLQLLGAAWVLPAWITVY